MRQEIPDKKRADSREKRGHLWDAVRRLGIDTLSGRDEHLREVLNVTASLEQLWEGRKRS